MHMPVELPHVFMPFNHIFASDEMFIFQTLQASADSAKAALAQGYADRICIAVTQVTLPLAIEIAEEAVKKNVIFTLEQNTRIGRAFVEGTAASPSEIRSGFQWAMKFFDDALKARPFTTDGKVDGEAGETCSRLGNAFRDVETYGGTPDLGASIKYHTRAIECFDLALSALGSAEGNKINTKRIGLESNIAYSYESIGDALADQGERGKALANYQKARQCYADAQEINAKSPSKGMSAPDRHGGSIDILGISERIAALDAKIGGLGGGQQK